MVACVSRSERAKENLSGLRGAFPCQSSAAENQLSSSKRESTRLWKPVRESGRVQFSGGGWEGLGWLGGCVLPRCTWCSPRRSRSGTARSWSSAGRGAGAAKASCGRRGRRAGSRRIWGRDTTGQSSTNVASGASDGITPMVDFSSYLKCNHFLLSCFVLVTLV